ncbi:hypothetical protein A2706_01820 [Candidatus Peribacteria bacterium RIFCSPHIGHO2_01_FULL_51_35]|nr:MAG: hypothetical protein A2706_01820 [Candidatus Peribacteria bacterium RIFCSPHIGHO2_01_FULL_51_35]
MHVRFSVCRGMSVTEEETQEHLGTVTGILIHPDTGKIEGFFVAIPGLFRSEQRFLASQDILRFGSRVAVRHAEMIFPIEEHVRLQPLLMEGRTVLRQSMRTESGKILGRCGDIQFDTKHFMVEWLFPRKLFRWGVALPLSSVIEVRKNAIIVRDSSVREPVPNVKIPSILKQFPEVAEARTGVATRKIRS